MNHFINTAAPDPTRARTVGLNQLTPSPFPVLFVGNRVTATFIFANNGVLEGFSGDPSTALRLMIADTLSTPLGGSWSIAVNDGDPLTIPYNADAASIEYILNANATVEAAGGVGVSQTGPGAFLIACKALGEGFGLTADASLLDPDFTAHLTTLDAGSSTTRMMVALTLRRSPVAENTEWDVVASPYAGWSGPIPLTTKGAIEYIRINGTPIGDGSIRQATTLLTLDTTDTEGAVTTRYQTPVILRAINTVLESPVADMTNYFFPRPAITGLAATEADPTKLGGLVTSAGTYPVGSVVQCFFANDVVAEFNRLASTASENVPFLVRPFDYNVSTNPYQWKLSKVTKQGTPCTWDADIELWTYLVTQGEVGAVSVGADQTGFSLPA